MTRSVKIIVSILVSFLAITLLWWRYESYSKTAHFVAAYDRSDSKSKDCPCMRSVAERAMATAGITNQSTFTVLATGDEATANEPVLIAQYQLPISRHLTEDPNAVNQHQVEILSDLATKCDQTAPTHRSPILLTISRSIEVLHTKGCDKDSRCVLYVISDGEELVDKSLKQVINGQTNNAQSAQQLNNEGIRIIFVGIAETKGSMQGKNQFTRVRDPQRARHLQDAWRAQFSAPDLVSFEPFCQSSNTISKQE